MGSIFFLCRRAEGSVQPFLDECLVLRKDFDININDSINFSPTLIRECVNVVLHNSTMKFTKKTTH